MPLPLSPCSRFRFRSDVVAGSEVSRGWTSPTDTSTVPLSLACSDSPPHSQTRPACEQAQQLRADSPATGAMQGCRLLCVHATHLNARQHRLSSANGTLTCVPRRYTATATSRPDVLPAHEARAGMISAPPAVPCRCGPGLLSSPPGDADLPTNSRALRPKASLQLQRQARRPLPPALAASAGRWTTLQC